MENYLGHICRFIDIKELELMIGLVVYDNSTKAFKIINLETNQILNPSDFKFVQEIGELTIQNNDNTKIFLAPHIFDDTTF